MGMFGAFPSLELPPPSKPAAVPNSAAQQSPPSHLLVPALPLLPSSPSPSAGSAGAGGRLPGRIWMRRPWKMDPSNSAVEGRWHHENAGSQAGRMQLLAASCFRQALACVTSD